jgi:hypothetical protein
MILFYVGLTLCGLPFVYSFGKPYYLHQKYNALTKQVQTNIIHSQEFTPLNITTTWHDKKICFLKSKASLGESRDITIQAYLHECEGTSLWLKMKNQKAYMKKNGKIECGEMTTAMKINQQIFRERQEENKKTLEVCFLEDVIFGTTPSSGLDWCKRPFLCNYNYHENKLYVQSPVLITSENLPIEQYAGLYYMKLITPDYVDYLIDTYGRE